MIDIVEIILWVAYFVSLYFTIFWFVVFLEHNYLLGKSKKNPLRDFPMVSIVVPAYNEEKFIKKTLFSLLNLDYPKERLEVIVVNDGSTDATRQVVESMQKDYPSLVLINQENKGKGAAMNEGLRAAKGEFFVSMDADSVVEAHALKAIIPYFQDKSVGQVMPLMKVHNPKNLLQKMQFVEYLINIYLKKLLGYLDCIHCGPGPFSVYRMTAIRKAGGYDEKIITEDLDLTYKIQKKNYKVLQIMDAVVYTDSPRTFKEFKRQRSRWYRGGIMTGLKHKDMLFNSEYGDFGLIQTPVPLLSGVLALVLLGSSFYYLLKPKIEYILHLRHVNFDLLTYLTNMEWNMNMLDLSYPNILIFCVMLFFSMVMFYYSHKYTREKLFKTGLCTSVVYVFLYFMILGIVWLGVFKDLLFKKNSVW